MKILGNFVPFEFGYQFNQTKINLDLWNSCYLCSLDLPKISSVKFNAAWEIPALFQIDMLQDLIVLDKIYKRG